MSKMLAELSRIVNEDISNRVTQYDVLYESITNAIHANANAIICKLKGFDATLKENETNTEVFYRKVDTMTIIDNGDGLNEDNYNSFCKYRSEFKKILGGKGVGRFVFLKLYENVSFVSQISGLNEKRFFKFSVDFDTDDIIKTSLDIETNSTEITLSKLTKQYYDQDKGVDRRIYLDLVEIKFKVLIHLLPILYFYKKQGKNIGIKFIDESNSEILEEITFNDIPEFYARSFDIKDIRV